MCTADGSCMFVTGVGYGRYADIDYHCDRCGHLHGRHYVDEPLVYRLGDPLPIHTRLLPARRGCLDCDCEGLA